MKKIYKRLFWGLLLSAASIGAVILLFGGTTNTAETSPEHPEPLMRTRRYEGDLGTVRLTVEEIIPALQTYGRKWRLVETGEVDLNHRVVIKAEVPVFIFADDLQVEIKRQSDKTVVNARSASRVGWGDWGENRRHILQLLEALDKKFR